MPKKSAKNQKPPQNPGSDKAKSAKERVVDLSSKMANGIKIDDNDARDSVVALKELLISANEGSQEALEDFQKLHRIMLANGKNREAFMDFMNPLMTIDWSKEWKSDKAMEKIRNLEIPSIAEIVERRSKK